ncbi:uncharacterized protein PRCAT00004489001 [Priceomyces carsonii]|uniref:uncharacterized protein n=1 Tax=Priceomyces carsonii TaxID=28549 RepID=UPI002ED88BBF|nr:unnamed protein product [Priceomyces carsonii]
MLAKAKEPSSRTQSIASRLLVDDSYDNVDIEKLYEAVVKCLIIEYRNEARFRTPIIQEHNNQTNSGVASSKYHRNSRIEDGTSDPKLPTYLIPRLESHLNLIAMKKKGNDIDDITRRSLLRLYSEMLAPEFKIEVQRVKKPEYLVMKFVSCANKEIVKIGTVPSNQISNVVFKQAGTFVQILISLIKKDKDSDLIIAKLNEHKESLKPSVKSPEGNSGSYASHGGSQSPVKFQQPSFRVTDMDQAMVSLIQDIFAIDQVKLQRDIFAFKELSQEKALHKDIEQTQFYLNKDLGQFTPKSFGTTEAYEQWKLREESMCQQLINKYKVPASQKLLPLPPLPIGYEFYILPRNSQINQFYVKLIQFCLGREVKDNTSPDGKLVDQLLLSKQSSSLLAICAKFWRIDVPTRVTSMFTAGHLCGILKDKLGSSEDLKELGPIDINNSSTLFNSCKKVIEESGLSWNDRSYWSLKDQGLWMKSLSYSYQEVLMSIRESLTLIFNKSVRPKFSPLLNFLGDYIESDPLFESVAASGIARKWEKRLSKTLLRVSETRYAELLSSLPRDDTLSILHILDISDNIVSDIRMIQKRYKNPLLGVLDVPRTSGAVMCAMFGADAKNILKHIDLYAKKKGQVLPFGDALEAYKSLSQIRYIYHQVSSRGSIFKFDLEAFFFPFVQAWVNESGEKISAIVKEALKKDNYEAIDLESDDKKYSSSVLDIFTLIKEFLKILNNLNWPDEYQLARMYTSLLKSISDGALFYANSVTSKIINELDEEEQKKLIQEEDKESESRKTGNWFDDVKNAVSNMQGSAKIDLEEPYNFKPETCVALNNLSAMMQNLDRLEEVLDPDTISHTVDAFNPESQRKYLSHIFSLRLIRAENLKSTGMTSSSRMRPYVTLVDTKARKTIGKTRASNSTSDPEWDEEFEITLPANSSLTVSVTVWDEKIGTHSLCGRSLLQLDPKNYKHDGIPNEFYLDLDSQGRVLVEIAVESERVDAIFVMGRAHRALKRSQDRCIKLIVEKFSRFIHYCFSRTNLRSICGNNGMVRPSQDQMDDAMMPLYDYLNMNLQVLAQYLSKELLLKVMLASWSVITASADELLLPKLSNAKAFHLTSGGSGSKGSTGWQSAVSSAMANVKNTNRIFGFGKLLTNIELETVFSWLNFLCFDFFHNDGNGPPLEDLKNEQYQALLLIPVYYDHDVDYLTLEVERLSPAFIKSLRDRGNFDEESSGNNEAKLSKTNSLVRNKTISANATAKSRAQAAQEVKEARDDPSIAQVLTEDIILRLLLIKDQRSYVARRLDQREKLARSIATERLARAATEGRFTGL